MVNVKHHLAFYEQGGEKEGGGETINKRGGHGS